MNQPEAIPVRRALLVASGSYADPGLKRLRSPVGDVRRLAAVLRDPAIGEFHVCEVVDRPTAEILQAIEQFFADGRRNDVLLLYVSGHGVIAKDGGLYFTTASTDLSFLRSTAVADSFVASSMRHCRSRSIVLMLDCCHSGAFGKGLTPKGALQVDIEHRFKGSGHVTLTASSALEYAFEEKSVEDLGAAKAGSLFTGFIIEGLSTGEADIDDDGDISVDELYSYVYEQVQSVAPQQRPGKSGTGYGELVIARSPRPPSLRVELRQALRSPLAGVRLAAVVELARLWTLRGDDADAVHAALQDLISDDDTAVAQAARSALTGHPTASAAGPLEVDAAGDTSDASTEPHASADNASRTRPPPSETGANTRPTAAAPSARTTERPGSEQLADAEDAQRSKPAQRTPPGPPSSSRLPEGVPRSVQRRERTNGRIVTGIVLTLLVSAGGTWLISPAGDPAAERSGRQTTPTATPPATATALSSAERSLLKAIPRSVRDDCAPFSSDRSARAALACDRPDYTVYYTAYRSRTAMDRQYRRVDGRIIVDDLVTTPVSTCAGVDLNHVYPSAFQGTWSRGGSKRGRQACGPDGYDKNALIVWTDDRERIQGHLEFGGADMNGAYRAWQRTSRIR